MKSVPLKIQFVFFQYIYIYNIYIIYVVTIVIGAQLILLYMLITLLSHFYSTQLVSSFQLEAQTRQHEAEQIRNKLSSVRRMIAKLLKSINEVNLRYFSSV